MNSPEFARGMDSIVASQTALYSCHPDTDEIRPVPVKQIPAKSSISPVPMQSTVNRTYSIISTSMNVSTDACRTCGTTTLTIVSAKRF